MNREIFKKAAEYLRTVGWRSDGEYGREGKPCCAIGAMAVVMGKQPWYVEGYSPEHGALRDRLQLKTGRTSVIRWNDEQETAEPVIALFEELAAETEVPQ